MTLPLTRPASTVFAGPGINNEYVKLWGTELEDAFDAPDFGDAVIMSRDGVTTDAHLLIENDTWQPTATFSNSEVGTGALRIDYTRTGGAGTYGLFMITYEVPIDKPYSYVDHVCSVWLDCFNMSGGRANGFWPGANGPMSGTGFGHTWSSGQVTSMEANFGNRWADFGILTSIGSGPVTAGIMSVPDPLPSTLGKNYWDVSDIAIGASADVSVTGHNFTATMGVEFYASAFGGTLPGGITEGTPYFVLASGLVAGTSFKFSTTRGGTPVTTTGSFAGTVKCVPSYPGTFAFIVGATVHYHAVGTGFLITRDSIQPGGIGMNVRGSAVSTSKPGIGIKIDSNWDYGIDMSAMSPGTAGIRMGSTAFDAILWGAPTAVGKVGIPSSGTGIELSAVGTSDVAHLSARNRADRGVSVGTTGSAPKLSFYGGTTVAKPTVSGNVTAIADANTKAVVTSILQAIGGTGVGLVTNSTT